MVLSIGRNFCFDKSWCLHNRLAQIIHVIRGIRYGEIVLKLMKAHVTEMTKNIGLNILLTLSGLYYTLSNGNEYWNNGLGMARKVLENTL